MAADTRETPHKMHSIYQLIDGNPVWTFIALIVLVLCVTKVVVFVVSVPLLAWSRFLRHLNVRNHGWPPPHCDADGDPVEKENEEP